MTHWFSKILIGVVAVAENKPYSIITLKVSPWTKNELGITYSFLFIVSFFIKNCSLVNTFKIVTFTGSFIKLSNLLLTLNQKFIPVYSVL